MHDLKLSRACNINTTFTGYQYPVSDIPVDARPSVAVFDTLFQPPTQADLSPGEVYDAVMRWDGIKVLADLYRRPTLRSDFLEATLPYEPPKVDGTDPASLNQQDFHLSEQPLAFDRLQIQDNFSRRIYQAISALWMLLEAIKLANTIQYTDVDEYKDVRQSIKSLMDSLDIKELFALCEVENFFYGFLMPKLFAPYATSWSTLCHHVAGNLGDRNTLRTTWKRTMKIFRLSLDPKFLHQLLCYYDRGQPLPVNMSTILRHTSAFGLRESNLIGRITNVNGLLPKQRLGAMDFDAKDLQRCVTKALRETPAYERISKSALSAGWNSFITSTGLGSWEDVVRGELTRLDQDWDDYRLAGLHAHIMLFHEKELAAKQEKRQERKAKREAARAAEIAANSGDTTEDDNEMDLD